MRLKFSCVFYIYVRKNHCFDSKCTRWIGFTFFEKLLLYRAITWNIKGVRMQKFHSSLTFFSVSFLLQSNRKAWNDRRQSFFPSTVSNHSQKFRHLFAVLHLRWLPSITGHVIARFLLNEIYQPLEISNFSLLVDIMPDFIIAISHKLLGNLSSYQLASYSCKTTSSISNYVKCCPKFEFWLFEHIDD